MSELLSISNHRGCLGDRSSRRPPSRSASPSPFCVAGMRSMSSGRLLFSLAQGLRTDGRRRRAPGSAAARKPADRHIYSGGHDLCRCGHGSATSPGPQAASSSHVLRNCGRRRHRDRRDACDRNPHLRSDRLGAGRKHDNRQRNERLRAGYGALSSGCAWHTLARSKRACRSALILQRRLRPMFKALSTPASCLVLIC